MNNSGKELPIIQKTYDLIKWYVPLLNKLPRDHKYGLGDRIIAILYETLEHLLRARYQRDKLALLQEINMRLEILRYQTRLLHDFSVISTQRYEYAGRGLNGIGAELGGWIRQQQDAK